MYVWYNKKAYKAIIVQLKFKDLISIQGNAKSRHSAKKGTDIEKDG